MKTDQTKTKKGRRAFFTGKALREANLSAGEYYGLYSLLFLGAAALVYRFYMIHGKSFVYCDLNGGGDGLVQAYNSFVYLGKYGREIIRNLLSGKGLQIPTWNLNIGYGQDILTTMSFYAFGEPLNLVSIVTPTRYAEWMYNFLILVRLYLSGITFSLYCRYRKQTGIYTLAGALVYTFCHYAVEIGTLHPQFLIPMVLFPLMCLGAEKVLQEERHILFILSCAVMALSNFYQFYIACMLIILYVLIRYATIRRTAASGAFPRTVLLFLRDGVLAVGIAAVLFLPSAMAILGASRVGADNAVPLLYERDYYLNLIGSFISGGGKYYAHLGYCAVGLLSVFALFLSLKERKLRPLAAAFFIMVLMLSLPFAGHVMNGFGYVVNRWVWGLSFLTACLTAVMLPEMLQFDKEKWKKLLILVCCYTALLMLAEQTRTEKNLAALILLGGTAMGLALAAQAGKRRLYAGCVFLLTVLMINQNAYYTLDPGKTDRLSRHVDLGTAYEQLIETSPAYAVKQCSDKGLYRYDTAGISPGDAKRNAGLLLGQPGIPFYFSTVNAQVSDFIRVAGLNYDMEQSFHNLNRRSMLEMLLGVRYLVIPEGEQIYLPYGFKETALETGGFEVHRSSLALPMAFVTDRYISRETFDALTYAQRQEALVQAVVLEDVRDTAQLSLTETTYVPEMEAEEGIEIDDGQIIVRDTSARLILKTQGQTDGEMYVQLENVSYSGLSPRQCISDGTWEAMPRLERNLVMKEERDWEAPTAVQIRMVYDEEDTIFVYRTPANSYYCGLNDCLCNLGYSGNERGTDIIMTFNAEGVYTFDSLKVIQQPVDELRAWRKGLVRDKVSGLKTGTNLIRGKVAIDQEGLVFLPVPYSEGWKGYIDGAEEKVLKADTAFLGMMVPSGEHTIEFRYHSPYLKEATAISTGSLALFAVLIFFERRKRRKADAPEKTVTE